MVGLENGNLVCPECWSLCVIRIIEKRSSTEWCWWCGCGWKSDAHTSPKKMPSLLRRFSQWRLLNGWREQTVIPADR